MTVLKFTDLDGEPVFLPGTCGGVFVASRVGNESVVTHGGSEIRRMLEITAPNGIVSITYETALALKEWLNNNVE